MKCQLNHEGILQNTALISSQSLLISGPISANDPHNHKQNDFQERYGDSTDHLGSGRGPAFPGAAPVRCNLLSAPLRAVKLPPPDGS